MWLFESSIWNSFEMLIKGLCPYRLNSMQSISEKLLSRLRKILDGQSISVPVKQSNMVLLIRYDWTNDIWMPFTVAGANAFISHCRWFTTREVAKITVLFRILKELNLYEVWTWIAFSIQWLFSRALHRAFIGTLHAECMLMVFDDRELLARWI